MGIKATANSNGATAIGNNAYAAGSAVAVGSLARADGYLTTAIGNNSMATDSGTALGHGAKATGKASAAIGYGSIADEPLTVSFGSESIKRRLTNIAAGINASDAASVGQLDETLAALGGGAGIEDGRIVAPEYQLDGSTFNTVGDALANLDGRVSTHTTQIDTLRNDFTNLPAALVVQHEETDAITVAASTGGASMNIGGTDGSRVLSGLANGSEDTDAVTIAQLKSAGLVDPEGRPLFAVAYDDVDLGAITLGGTGGTLITNLGAGLIAQGSSDAINGGQLWEIKESLESQIGDLDDRVETIEKNPSDGGDNGSSGGGDWSNDAGGKPITDVGDGQADSDAATVGQINDRLEQAKEYTDSRFDTLQDSFDGFRGDVDRRFGEMDKRIDRMSAVSAAYAGMALNTAGLAGRNRLGVGMGAQNGKSALAVGYQRILGKKSNVSVSLGGAFSGSERSVTAGAGFGW